MADLTLNISQYSPLQQFTVRPWETFSPDDQLAITDKINLIVQTLNRLGKLSNDVVTDWNKVMTWVSNDGMTAEVDSQLQKWKDDGTLVALINAYTGIGDLSTLQTVAKDTLVNAINENVTHLADIATNVKSKGVINDGVTDVSSVLQTAINNAPVNSEVFVPSGTYAIGTMVTITKDIKLIGNNAKFLCVTNGLSTMFSFTTPNVYVEGITFDNNLKGRGSLFINDAVNVEVHDCAFTGYSADYGYYQTDSAVMVNNPTVACKTININNNIFHDNGNQYDNTTYLNRCITIQGAATLSKAIIDNNFFTNVNQGIATTSTLKSLIFSNNIIDGVRDNSMYILGTSKSVVADNDFLNGSDESIVVYGDDVNISGNNFTEIPNKVVAVNGSIQNLNISNNNYRNETTPVGSLIAFRHITDIVTNLSITGNIVHLKVSNATAPRIGYFGYVTNFLINENIINAVTVANQVLFYFEQNSNGRIENNRLVGGDFTTSAVSLGAAFTSGNITFKKNDIVNVRVRADNAFILVDGYVIQDNIGPYANANSLVREAYLNRAPIIGTWRKQDRIYNTSPAASGYFGWVCVTTGTANTTAWAATTAYTVGQQVNANGNVYQCATAGTSGSTAPTGTGTGIVDGTVTWNYVAALAVFKGFGTLQA